MLSRPRPTWLFIISQPPPPFLSPETVLSRCTYAPHTSARLLNNTSVIIVRHRISQLIISCVVLAESNLDLRTLWRNVSLCWRNWYYFGTEASALCVGTMHSSIYDSNAILNSWAIDRYIIHNALQTYENGDWEKKPIFCYWIPANKS